MSNSTKTLPEGYVQSGEINLKKNKRLAVVLNIVAFPVALLSFFLLSGFAVWVRPGLTSTSITMTVGGLAVLLGLVLMLLTIHELIHGVFFWVFTRSRPVFLRKSPQLPQDGNCNLPSGTPAGTLPVRRAEKGPIRKQPLILLS